jgi:hypothetical protein
VGALCALAGASCRSVDERAKLGTGHTAMLVSGQKSEPGLLTALRIMRAFSLGRDGRLWLLTGEGEAPSADRARAAYLVGGGHAPKMRHPRVSAKGAARSAPRRSPAKRSPRAHDANLTPTRSRAARTRP